MCTLNKALYLCLPPFACPRRPSIISPKFCGRRAYFLNAFPRHPPVPTPFVLGRFASTLPLLIHSFVQHAPKLHTQNCMLTIEQNALRCLTEDGKALTQVCIIDFITNKVIMDQLVKPPKSDYRLSHSGCVLTTHSFTPFFAI